MAVLKHNLASSVADSEGALTPLDHLSHILRMLEVAPLLEAIWAGVAIFLAVIGCFHNVLLLFNLIIHLSDELFDL